MRKIPLLLLAIAALCLGAASNLDAQNEFDPGGYDAMRVENEIKLVVPRTIQDSVWAYLKARYSAPDMYLKAVDSSFHAKIDEDYFRDQYFDNDTFQLLSMQCGVRHRSRIVLTNPESRKNGRELMQIKINHIDGNTLNRGEFKYKIRHYKPGGNEEPLDAHPFLGLVKRDNRQDIIDRLKEYKVDADKLAPTILITQLRKRVYLFTDTIPFATLTLDIDTAFYEGDTTLFTELELELNEIRYTESDGATRAEMEKVNDMVKGDILTRFPSIHQDQTPKYNKAAIAFKIDPKGGSKASTGFPVIPVAAGASVLLIVLAVVFVRGRKRRETRQQG